MEPKDTHNETVSVRPSKAGKESPETAPPPAQSTSGSSSEKKPRRQTSSANPVSPDDLLAEQDRVEDDNSWIPLASAFAVGLVVGLIAGVLIGRD